MLLDLLKRFLRRTQRAPDETAPSTAPATPEAEAASLHEGLQLYRLRRYGESLEVCRLLLARCPDDPQVLQLLAAALFAQGSSREALEHLRRAVALAPDSAETHAALASALAQCGDVAAAIDEYRHSVRLRAGLADAWCNLGLLLKLLGRYDESEACARAGLHADERHARLHHVLSGALFEQGHVDAAIAEARIALRLDPGAAEVHSDFIRMLNYAEGHDAAAIFREHLSWDAAHARSLTQEALHHRNNPDPERRLKVGFVSPYFRKHAMTFFFESLVEHHDPQALEIILYADVERPDEYSARLRAYGAAWRDTAGLSHEALAQAVRRDRVDVLVDLSGHTPRNRLLAFAHRPAPVQVTWNGYPNTTGMTAMDYRITDAICDPPGTTEHLHAERLVRLPAVLMTWQAPRDAPQPGPLPALAMGRVTFGSFNSCFKVTAGLVELWTRILHRVEGSRLMLLTVSGEAAERRLRGLFEAQGIGSERLEFLPRMSHEEFLSAHLRADIALDTYPYHGTTTTCFSLWMGVPVVVLAGITHASRVGASLLENAGLPELVARDGDDYVDIACRLAAGLSALAALRAGLRERLLGSPLTDGKGGALAFEAALRGMWRTWCESRLERNGRASGAAAEPRNLVVQSHYGPIVVNRHDTMIGRHIAREGWWEKDEIELLRWVLGATYGQDRDIEIVDVGAYTGAYTIALARFPFPRVTVHAFEAQREIYEMLVETVKLNGLNNVHCHQRAVAAESGRTIRFQSVDYDEPANFGSLEIEPVAHADFDGRRVEGSIETVTTMRIDDLELKRARLIKIDAEGMEHKVLAGAAAVIARCRPLLFLEYEKTDFEAVKVFLRRAGYRSYYCERPNLLGLPEEFAHIRFEGALRVRY